MASTNKRQNKLQARWVSLLHILLLLILAVVATWSMWQAPALVAGHSARKDLARLVEFDAAVRAGEVFPAWSPDLYAGYGSPIFQFYAPLAYYAAEVPVLMGFNYATALKITWLLTLFASGVAMYRLASTYFSAWAACLGSVFYMVAPYRLIDMFIRHALAEHCAFIWLPLIVWGTARFATNLSRGGFSVGAIASAALILTHNVMALIGLPVCVAVALVFALSAEDGRLKPATKLWALAGVVPLIGVGLAAFFWWSAITGRALTYAEESLTGGYYDFHRHFVQAWQFIDTHWNFGTSGGDTGKEMPLQIGLPHLLAALAALVMVVAGWQGQGKAGRIRVVWSIVGLCVVAIGAFMCCRWSQSIWQWVPLLRYVQFPWRFLGLVVFGSAMCATALGDRIADFVPLSRQQRSQPDKVFSRHPIVDRGSVSIVLVIIAMMGVYFPYYSRVFFFTGDARTRSVVRVTAREVEAMQSSGVLIPFGLSMTAAELRAIKERATSGDDFLPRDVKEKPTQPPTDIAYAQGGRVIDVVRLHQNFYRSRLEMSETGKAGLLQFWFPGWHARVDGVPVTTAPTGPQAIVSCDLPAGDHIVEFTYTAWPRRGVGIIISILSAVIGVCAVGFLRQRQGKGRPARHY
jgi:hypothetical protein